MSSSAAITVHFKESDGRKVDCTFSTTTGCLLFSNDSLYPREVKLLLRMIELFREQKDTYPPEPKQGASNDQ